MNYLKKHLFDGIVILVLVLFSVTGLLVSFAVRNASTSHIANVYHEKEKILSLDLSKESEERYISLESYSLKMILTVRKNEIKVKDSDCKNKTCINTGYISSGDIICAYNQVTISIESSQYDLEI